KGISDISIAKNKNELSSLLTKNAELYGSPMLVEEYIHGREFTVGIIGNDDDTTVFAPMEIVYKKTTQENFCVYSYNVKQNYKEFIEYHCPACLAPNEEIEMKSAAVKVYNMLGCVDFSRVDFRMSDDGKIYFIEINPLPGLAPGYSDYPMLAEFCGTSYGKLVNSVLDAARKRLGK
ncbi:MAG: ATP-grasp domain-containing protein, partial [Clostridia bacterium]